MSDNNSDNPPFFDPTKEKGEITAESEISSGSESVTSNEEGGGKEEGKFLEGTSNDDKSEKQIVTGDEDDDGFKTPMSEEHRIPAITECPPAPRKPRPSELKRRRSPETLARRCLEFDELEEVEPMFRPPVPDIGEEEDGENKPENKKARGGDEGI